MLWYEFKKKNTVYANAKTIFIKNVDAPKYTRQLVSKWCQWIVLVLKKYGKAYDIIISYRSMMIE